jgi:hypothetical protein
MPLQVVQVRNSLLSVLGFDVPAAAPTLALDDVTIALNGAMQMLQTAGEDYFTRTTLTQIVSAGTASYMLPQAAQNVIGPIRLDGRPLMALENQGQYDQYDRIFNGGSSFGPGSGVPKSYHCQSTRVGTVGDISRIFIWLAPMPITSGLLSVEIVNDAVSYVVGDLSSTAEMPIGQNYTETIFLPIARFLVTRSSLFSRQELLKPLTSDYQTALARLGFTGGFPNATQQLPKREVQA